MKSIDEKPKELREILDQNKDDKKQMVGIIGCGNPHLEKAVMEQLAEHNKEGVIIAMGPDVKKQEINEHNHNDFYVETLSDLQERLKLLEMENNTHLVQNYRLKDDIYCHEYYDETPKKLRGVEFSNARDSNKDPKINRNAPCTCGSGKKYKKCCGRN